MFLMNKKILDNSLQERLLISQPLIYSHFTSENTVIHEYIVRQALKKCRKLASWRCKLVLEKSNKETVDLEKCGNWKIRLQEITNVKNQKKVVQETIEFLNKGTAEYLEDAEKKRDVTSLSKEILHHYK